MKHSTAKIVYGALINGNKIFHVLVFSKICPNDSGSKQSEAFRIEAFD